MKFHLFRHVSVSSVQKVQCRFRGSVNCRRGQMQPLSSSQFSFGVIADIQYGDKESKCSRTRPDSVMQYRQGVTKLNHAVQEWLYRKDNLSFVLNLGDVIDGNLSQKETLVDFYNVMEPFERLRETVTVHHVIGNHCLRVPSNILLKNLHLHNPYYSRPIHEGWRLIVLNSNDLGPNAEGDNQKRETEEFLKRIPLSSQPNVQQWNGGLASEQIEWFRNELEKAKILGERVIIGCHHPFGKASARETHMAWNASLMESIVLESGIVALVLSGHDHTGGYSRIDNTHFLTLHGVVEAPDTTDAFAIIHISPKDIEIEGFGVISSKRYSLVDRVVT